jgi:hypothetical protein
MKPKIFFGIAIYRAWEYESQQYLTGLIQNRKGWEVGKFHELYEISNITKARNILAAEFLKSDCSHLFLFDVDMVGFDFEGINLLVKDNKEIVGAPYIFKRDPFKPAFVCFNDDDYDLRKKTDTFTVKYVSGGFMMIKREVIERLTRKYQHPFATYDTPGGQYIPEDWSICDRAREMCMITWLNPKITLGHLGKYAYTMLDFYRIYNIGGAK